MQRTLIGLVGMKSVGKSTIGEHLQAHHGLTELSFATPLKKICSEVFHIPPNAFERQVTKELVHHELKVSPRQLMQGVGTGLFREELSKHIPDLNLGPTSSIWIYHMMKRLEQEPGLPVVITDVRFADECDFITSYGGHLMYIDRYDNEKWCLDKHVSEQAHQLRSLCDVVIDNTGSMVHCLEQVDAYMNQI